MLTAAGNLIGECYRRSPNFKTAKIKVIAVVAMHARTRDRQIETRQVRLYKLSAIIMVL